MTLKFDTSLTRLYIDIRKIKLKYASLKHHAKLVISKDTVPHYSKIATDNRHIKTLSYCAHVFFAQLSCPESFKAFTML